MNEEIFFLLFEKSFYIHTHSIIILLSCQRFETVLNIIFNKDLYFFLLTKIFIFCFFYDLLIISFNGGRCCCSHPLTLKLIRSNIFSYFLFADAIIEDQVWKEKIDLQFFQQIMQQCSSCNSDYKTVRYISFISDEGDENASSNNTGDDEEESNDVNSTGGEKELSEVSTADQIFLETTV